MNKSAIVKQAQQGQVPRRPGAIVRRLVIDARESAREITDSAEQRAAETRATLDREVARARAAAFQAGWTEALGGWEGMMIAAAQHRRNVLMEAEEDLLKLAVKIAEKIIGQELKVNSGAIAGIVSAALRQIRNSESVTITVHPDDVPTLTERSDQVLGQQRHGTIEILSDPHLQRGDCRIETATGTIDARLDVQLRALERALLTSMQHQQSRRQSAQSDDSGSSPTA